MRKYPRTDNPWGFASILLCLMVLALAIACGGGGDSGEPAADPEPMEEAAEESMAEESAEGSGAPRIFFITPEDGATVTSPVSFEFGHEIWIIEPKGPINEGAGHHHIGLDIDCLPPGTPIPEADPWVHFGDGSAVIDMQLPPGEHKLTIQIGDGEHVTLEEPGLCQTITITVEES